MLSRSFDHSHRIDFRNKNQCSSRPIEQNSDYKPISCDLYDRLEIWSMRKTLIEIEFEHQNKIHILHTKIRDLKSIQAIEYLITDENKQIRLDHLISATELK